LDILSVLAGVIRECVDGETDTRFFHKDGISFYRSFCCELETLLEQSINRPLYRKKHRRKPMSPYAI